MQQASSMRSALKHVGGVFDIGGQRRACPTVREIDAVGDSATGSDPPKTATPANHSGRERNRSHAIVAPSPAPARKIRSLWM